MAPPSTKDIRLETEAKAKAIREQAQKQAASHALRLCNEECKDDVADRLERFRLSMREGTDEEKKNALLEANREIEQHRKLLRINKSCMEWVNQFTQIASFFNQMTELAEKLDTFLFRIRHEIKQSGETPTLQAKQKAAQFNLEKSQKDRRNAEDRILELREKIEYQIQKDRQSEQKLLDTLKRSLQYVSKAERGKLEVLTRQKIEGVPVEERIRFLSKFIEHLAHNVPVIRHNETDRLLGEARDLTRQKNYTEAILTLDQLFKFDRKHLAAHRLRAEIYQKMGNPFAFLCELRMICEIENAEGRDFFCLAEVLIQQGKREDAYKLLETAVQKEQNARYLETLGDIAGELGYWYRAVQAYQQVLGQVPSLVRLKHKLGIALFQDKREDEAFNLLREAIAHRDDNADSRVCVGRKFRQLKATFLAEQCFARAVELDPNHTEAHYWWGMMQYDRGQFEAARIHAQTVITADATRPRNLLLLAKCHAALGNGEEALKLLYPIVTRKSPPPPVDLVLCYSEICRNASKTEQALALIEVIHQRFPYQPQIKAEYAMLLVHAGQLDKAQQYMAPSLPTP